MKMELLNNHVFVTKLAGFEHSEYIQKNETKNKICETDIPLVQGKNIRNGKFVEKYDWYISKNISDSLQRSKLTKEAILIPYVGSNLGEVGIFYHPYDCHLASNIAKIELNDDYFDIEYLKYYLQSPVGQSYLFQAKQGSAQPNITMESIRETLIIDNDKSTQKNIASFLNSFDKKINNNIEIVNLYYEQLDSIYSYYMGNNESVKCESFVNLGNIKTGKKDANFADENGKYNFFTCGQNTLKCNEYDFDLAAILIAGNGDFNVKHYTGKFNAYQRTYVIEPIEKKYYGVMYLAAKYMIDTFKMGSNGSIVKFITIDDINGIQVKIPSDNILNLINSIIHQIEGINNENEKLIKLKNTFLPMLFNGQVKLKEVE